MNWQTKLSDPAFLLSNQYKDASNLNARIELHRRFSTNTYGWMRWVFDQLDLPPQCHILDLGCGPASLWQENLDRIPEGWDITLTDLSPGMIEQAQGNLQDSGRLFKFDVVDAQSIPYDDASFDAVVANHMLYHVPDRPKALAEMQRVLQPGGKLCASTIGEGHLQELYEIVGRFDPEGKFKRAISISPFTLESGAAQLAPWFSRIALHRYEDDLEITEAELLVAYIMSMVEARSVFTDERLAALVTYVEQEIAAHGRIHITKDSGLFAARKQSSDE